tara:strand:+ start:1590 stop:4553 length:2964 start_codon:yes stop_codon:yes gene_type:complete
MQPSEELQIRKAIESGSLSPSMELQARKAIDLNAEDVSELITNISGGSIPSYRRGSFEDIVSKTEPSPSVFKGFASEDVDTKSGIQNAGFRAELSLAETDDDQVAVLRRYGLDQTDFARDNRGRLAVTPAGAAKLGVDAEKLTLIDEEGFSRNDISDLAGIAPEVIGAIGGAITGQALIPIPILGAALGAGLGAGGGQGAEEIFEAVRGTQTQTDEEVLSDVATEATIGFLADATFGVLGAAVKGAKSSVKPGKGLTDEELKIAGESLEMGITPTLSAVKAPAVVARQQGITEKIFGTSDRLKRNNEVMQQKLADFRARVGAGTDEEAGEILLSATGKEAAILKDVEREAQEAVLKTLDDLAQDIGAATEKNLNLEDETFQILANAQKAFDDQMNILFKPIDDALESAAGTSKIIPIGNVKGLAAEAKKIEASGLAGGTMKELDSAIKAVNTLKATDSFEQIYKTRKTLNDILARSRGTEANYISNMINALDSKLTVNNIDNIIRTAPTENAEILRRAAERLDVARGQYKRGADVFDELEAAGVIKRLRQKTKDGQSVGIDDVRMDKIIKNDKPKVLARTLKAVRFAAGGTGREADVAAEQFRQKLAGEWLRDTLNKSGINALDNYAPETFKGAGFAKAVKDLGRTADTLFGADAAKVKQLASQIDRTALSNMDQQVVNQILKEGGDDNLVGMMQRLVNAQKEIFEANKSSAFRKLSRNELNSIEAAELIAHRSTTASDIAKIVKSFEGDDAALAKIQGNYMERLIADFGDTLTTDGKSLKAFSQRLLDANEGGKLTAIFGKDMGEEMAQFAKILEFNAKTAAGGDLVAANIAASPIQNLGKLVKFTVIGKVLSSGGYYKDITKQYKKQIVGEAPEERARTLGRLISQSFANASVQTPPQLVQEGINEAEKQITSVMDSSGLNEQLSAIQNQMTPPNAASSLGSVNVTQPVAGATGQPSIRQQAAANPGVAQALGIRGSTAGLLGNP